MINLMNTNPGYRINVVLRGEHYFTTEPIIGYDRAANVFADLCKVFTEKEGFRIEVTYWQYTGTAMPEFPKPMFP